MATGNPAMDSKGLSRCTATATRSTKQPTKRMPAGRFVNHGTITVAELRQPDYNSNIIVHVNVMMPSA